MKDFYKPQQGSRTKDACTSKQKQQRSGTVLSNDYEVRSQWRMNHSMQEILDLFKKENVKGLIKEQNCIKNNQDLRQICVPAKPQLTGRSLMALCQLCTSASSYRVKYFVATERSTLDGY